MLKALFAWWGTSKATSAGLRYRAATQEGNLQEALKQADRFGSGIGMLTFVGFMGGFDDIIRRLRGKK